jgi:hypothetical protein
MAYSVRKLLLDNRCGVQCSHIFWRDGKNSVGVGSEEVALDSREGYLLGGSTTTIVLLPLQLSREKGEEGLMVSGESAEERAHDVNGVCYKF